MKWPLLFASLMLPGCGTADKAQPLCFDHRSYDVSEAVIVDNNKSRIRHGFPFRNCSEMPVRIKSVKTSCSCAAVAYPKDEIPPGGRGEITLSVDPSGRQGLFRSSAVVALSGTGQLDSQLALSAMLVSRRRLLQSRSTWATLLQELRRYTTAWSLSH